MAKVKGVPTRPPAAAALEMTGGGASTERVMVRESVPVTLATVRTTVKVPRLSGEPLMVPSVLLTTRPSGAPAPVRPVAVNVAGVLLRVIGPNRKLRPCTAVAASGGVLRMTGAMGLTVRTAAGALVTEPPKGPETLVTSTVMSPPPVRETLGRVRVAAVAPERAVPLRRHW